jgi:hypothetical protein
MDETRILIRFLGCIFHGTGNSARLCQNFGIISGGGGLNPQTSLQGTPVSCGKTFPRNNALFILSHHAFRINAVPPALQKLPNTHAHTQSGFQSYLKLKYTRAMTDRCRSLCCRIARSLSRVCGQHHTSRNTDAHNHRH